MQNKNLVYAGAAVTVLVLVFYCFYALRMASTTFPEDVVVTQEPPLETPAPVEEVKSKPASAEEAAAAVNAQDMAGDEAYTHSVMESETHLHQEPEVTATQLLEIRAKAEKGDAYAQGTLGEMYHKGMGVERDLSKAFYWFRQGGEGNDPTSMTYLGRYYSGEFPQLGVRDYDMAERWLQPLAVEGDGYAMLLLGSVLYKRVREGEKDRLQEAAWWYNKGTGGAVDENYTPPALLEKQQADG